MSKGKIIKSPFKAGWWVPERHSQTLYPTLFRRPVAIALREEVLELPDGDFVELSWTQDRASGPLIILLHGLEGSIESAYAKGILKTIEQKGWQGVLMHFRGCGKAHNRLPRSYHSGDSADIDYFIGTLRERFPDRPLGAIGVSLGGNVLLKYLGEQGEASLLTAAMAISVPFELANTARHLGKGFAKVYQRHLCRSVQNKLLDKFKTMSSPVSADTIKAANTIYSFDDKVTAPLHGFTDAEDYYARSSSKPLLKKIAIPTYILHSQNDPFMTEQAIPTEADLSPTVTLELTKSGGHVGFVYGKTPFTAKYWIEKRLTEFFSREFSSVI
jgi:predicted alpha/beta-fold hydrolase